MGPQPLGHGYYGVWRDEDAIKPWEFQWGHNLSVMDTILKSGSPLITRQRSFNGATTSRSWILGGIKEGRTMTDGFNGATTSRSWIPVDAGSGDPGRGVSMGPQPLGHGYNPLMSILNRPYTVSMGPQPLGHGYSSQMHDFVSRSLSFDENATILHLPSRVALRFPSPFCTFDSRFCERSPFERQFGNVLSHT